MPGVYQPNYRFEEDNGITPSRIGHRVEEIYADGALEQRYNYLVYHFERGGHCISARAYLDEIDRVDIHGPFESESNPTPVEDSALFDLVLAYMKRRFATIKKLVDGKRYEVIWSYTEGS